MASVIKNEQFRTLLKVYPKRAVTLLHALYRQRLKNIAFSIVRDKEIAEDIIQEIFQDIWKNREQLSRPHEQSILNYLAKAVRYKCISHFRRVSRHYKHTLLYSQENYYHSGKKPFDDEPSEDEIAAEMQRLISSLSKREQECFLMNTQHDMSVGQIAIELKIARKTVEMFLTSARKKIKNLREKKTKV